MKKKINISILIILLVVGFIAIIIMIINFKLLKTKNRDTNIIVNVNGNPNMDSLSNEFSKIRIDFEKHTDKDNIIPETLMSLKKADIKEIYDKLEYDKYEFIVCTDIYDTLHIAYLYNDSYYSMGQIEKWSDVYVPGYTSGDGIAKFEDILGYSGVKVKIITGAAAADIIYIAIDKQPFFLISDCVSSDFTENDINGDGQKELLQFDNFMYINDNNELYKAKYIFDKTKIKQIYYNDETEQYDVYFNAGNKYDGNKKGYKYDTKEKCLIKIPK